MNSSWFNRTEDSDGVFVPMSCCVPVTLQSEEIVTSEGVVTFEEIVQSEGVVTCEVIVTSEGGDCDG